MDFYNDANKFRFVQTTDAIYRPTAIPAPPTLTHYPKLETIDPTFSVFQMPNVCGVCGNTFRNRGGLKRHLRTHSKEQQATGDGTTLTLYKCNLCGSSFDNGIKYENHIQNEHTGSSALKCIQCGCFRLLSNNCLTEPFKCESCFTNNTQQQPQQQTQQQQPLQQQPLIQHQQHTLQQQQQPQQQQQNLINVISASEALKFRLKLPIKMDPNINLHQPPLQQQELIKLHQDHLIQQQQHHQLQHQNISMGTTSLKSIMPSVKITITPKQKPYKCTQCEKSFKHSSTLAMHRKTHTGAFKYKCEYCDKEFYVSEYYIRHMRVHTKEKPYECDICQKSFSQSNTLTQHRRTHTGEKPYTCQECGKQFSVKDYLNKHMRTHTGDKPYICKICSKRYTQSSGLKTHQKSHFKVENYC